MNKLNAKMMKTPDLNQERLETLKNLFPDLFTIEGELNPDELKKIIAPSLANETERFEFKWFGKSEAKRIAFTPSQTTVVYDEARSYKPECADGNMIIEGENLDSLKVLLNGYRGKIKCIYIDPPYNTGNDFVYADNFDESKENYWEHIGVTCNGVKITTNNESDGRYHSNWLNLIYPRLLLARQLLTEDGVIFISINDKEYPNLRKVCDEVFGEINFVCTFVWQSKKGGGNDAGKVVEDHEYIICYSKDIDSCAISKIEIENEELDKIDDKGKYRIGRELNKWGSNSRRIDRPTMWFPIQGPNNEDVFPIKNDGTEGRWRLGKNNMLELVANKDVEFVQRQDGTYIVYEKIRTTDSRFKPYRTFIKESKTTADGSKDVKILFNDSKVFDFAKPKELISQLIEMAAQEDGDYILDFFAGSGTTAASVIDLSRGKTNRHFILVQIHECTSDKSEAYKNGFPKISDITIERVKRHIMKIEEGLKKKQQELLDSEELPFKTGFKVYMNRPGFTGGYFT